MEDSTEEHENNIIASQQSADTANDLIDEIVDLQKEIKEETAAGNDCSEMQAELESKLSQLNSTLGDTTYEYNRSANALSAGEKEMKAYVKQAQKNTEVNELLAEQSEYYDELTDVSAKLETAKDELYAATQAASDAESEYMEIASKSTTTQAELEQAWMNKETALDEATKKEKAAQENIEKWEPLVEQYQTAGKKPRVKLLLPRRSSGHQRKNITRSWKKRQMITAY